MSSQHTPSILASSVTVVDVDKNKHYNYASRQTTPTWCHCMHRILSVRLQLLHQIHELSQALDISFSHRSCMLVFSFASWLCRASISSFFSSGPQFQEHLSHSFWSHCHCYRIEIWWKKLGLFRYKVVLWCNNVHQTLETVMCAGYVVRLSKEVPIFHSGALTTWFLADILH